MLNFNYNKERNTYNIIYNTDDGIKTLSETYEPLKVVEDPHGIYTNLDNSKTFSRANKDNESSADYMYTCLYNPKYNKPDYYLNTVLQHLEILDNIRSPRLLFYDIETNEYAVEDAGKDKGRINSIAYIFDNEEHILVKDIDGTEREILTKFFKYCQDKEVMGLVGYNSFKFDNLVLFNRARALNVDSKGLQYNNCNLDVMELANIFQYIPKGQHMSLESLANKLGINEAKTDTSYYNPVTLYNDALKDPELMKTFKEYNIQDVRLTIKCFEGMESEQQLNELFKQTLTPFNKMQYNSTLLNCYTCKEALQDKKVINESVDTPIKFKNSGGFNYYKETDTLQQYNNVCVFDIVSYYPHLLQIIGADPTHEYSNINRSTGEISKFKEVPNGYLAKLSKDLYESRAKTKQERDKHKKDSEEYKTLDFEQQTKKIIVNSLYGVLSQKGNYYVLKNELIGATITALGRDLLNHIIETFNGVYGKTDSVFIPLLGDTDSKVLLDTLNQEINKYFKTKYNLENKTKDGQLIRFEIDDVLKQLIVKDKNNYIKVSENGNIKLKGSSFYNSQLSDFEQDLNQVIIEKLVDGSNQENIIKVLENFTETKLNEIQQLDYYSSLIGLSEKRKDQVKYSGRSYMDKHNIQYLYGFKYYICRVVGFQQDYIMYPKGYKVTDYELYRPYAYEMMANRLKNTKVISKSEAESLKQKHHVIKAKNNKVDKGQSNLFTPIPTKAGSNKKTKNSKFLKLNELIPDTLETYEQGLIKFVPVINGEKRAKLPKGAQYTYKYIDNNSEVFDPTTFNENDNIGLVRGYGNIAVLDVDGVKSLGTKKNQELKNYLMDILQTIDYPFIIQRTQSNGYHCLYYTEDTGNFNLNNIYWPVERPDDFPEIIDDKDYKEHLSNQTLGSSVIEVFQDLNGYIVFAPSTTKDGEYKLLSDNYTWKQLINEPIKDMETKIDKVFKTKGFNVENRTIKPDGNNTQFPNTTYEKVNIQVDCTPKAIKKLTSLTVDLLKEAHKPHTKHFTVLYLFGYYSNHITRSNAETIITNSLKDDDVKEMVEDHEHAYKTAINNNYDNPQSIKKTLNGVIEENPNNPKVQEIIDNIVEVIKGETMEDTPTNKSHTITETKNTPKTYEEMEAILEKEQESREIQNNTTNTNTDQVFNYSNTGKGSFLTAQSPIKYRMSKKHIEKLKNKEKELIQLFEEKDGEHIEALIHGGYRHYKLDSKVKFKGTVPVYDPKDVYHNNDGLYGFPTIKKAIENNTEDNTPYSFDVGIGKRPEDKTTYTIHTKFESPKRNSKLSKEQEKAINRLNNLKRVIDEMTVLNQVYYVCDGYTQINNELYTTGKKGRSKIGYFAFTNIERVVKFSPVKKVISPEQSYNFTIKTFKNKTLTYENFTIEMIVKELYNKGLLIKGDNSYKSMISQFIMETDKKQGLKIAKLPVCPGLFYDKKNHEIISYFPDLENKYTLKEGVEALNNVFDNVFGNKIKYGTIYWAYYLQILCNIFKDMNLANGLNRHLLLLNEGGTFKSTILMIGYISFTTTNRLEEQNEGDTISAILRNAKNSTLPLTNDDPKLDINHKDFKDILKSMAYSYTANVVAEEQYGNNTNNRDSFRLLATSHNESNFTLDRKGGEHRRVNIAMFNESDKPTEEQLDALNKYTFPGENGDIYLVRLNSIGEEFIRFITNYFEDTNPTKQKRIRDTKGWIIIDDFINHLETETGIELNNALKTRYEWDDLTENESIKLRQRLRYDYETTLKNTGIKQIEYDEDTVKEYLSISPMFIKRSMKDTQGNPKPTDWLLLKDEFTAFLESRAGLNRHINMKEILKMLDMPENYKFKKTRIKSNNPKQETGMILTPGEILEFFYNVFVIE